jgi:hypothetical protein
MHFDRGAIQAHMLAADRQNLLLLQPGEDPVQYPRFTPAIHPGVDRMPVAKLFWQAAPFATMLYHIKQDIESKLVMLTLPRCRGRQSAIR